MKETLTAIFEKSPQGYIGYVEEFPGANTQEATVYVKWWPKPHKEGCKLSPC